MKCFEARRLDGPNFVAEAFDPTRVKGLRLLIWRAEPSTGNLPALVGGEAERAAEKTSGIPRGFEDETIAA